MAAGMRQTRHTAHAVCHQHRLTLEPMTDSGDFARHVQQGATERRGGLPWGRTVVPEPVEAHRIPTVLGDPGRHFLPRPTALTTAVYEQQWRQSRRLAVHLDPD